MNYKQFVLLVCLILTTPHPASAETNDITDFKRNLMGIDITDPALYQAQLEVIVKSAKEQGAPFAQLIVVALEVGIPLDLFMAAAMKYYSAEEVVLAAITSGGEPAESIKTAILSGGDPADVEAGAIEAGISPVEAATMVSVALSILSEKEAGKNSRKIKDEEGLGLSPGEGGPDGGLPGSGGVGPVGGAGGGVASPS